MKGGNFLIGDPSVIQLKCTKCDYIDTMDLDIACEVLDVTRYKGNRCYYAYCSQCNHKMYPLHLMDTKESESK